MSIKKGTFFWKKIIPCMTITIILLGMQFWLPSNVCEVSKTKRIVVASQIDPDKDERGRFVKRLYMEAFILLRLKKLVHEHYPAARASLMAGEREVGGELSRVSHNNEAHPVLIRVDKSAFVGRFCAFATNLDLKIQGWDSLKDTPYCVEYQRGNTFIHQELTKLVPPENLIAIAFEIQRFIRLLTERTNLCVHGDLAVMELLNSERLRRKSRKFGRRMIHKIGVLDIQTIHAFLYEQHQSLSLGLSAVLKEMKAKGLVEHYGQIAKRL